MYLHHFLEKEEEKRDNIQLLHFTQSKYSPMCKLFYCINICVQMHLHLNLFLEKKKEKQYNIPLLSSSQTKYYPMCNSLYSINICAHVKVPTPLSGYAKTLML